MGLAVSTLRVQISALSVFFQVSLARDQLVARFFKALERLRPVVVRSVPQWNLSTVLQVLTAAPFEPLDEVSLRNLTLKTVFLVAITSARRVSELQALSIKEPFLSIFEDRVVLRTDPAFLPKVASRCNRVQEIILPTFCPKPVGSRESGFHCLDVRRCLLQYLKISKEFRRSESLFVLFSGRSKGKQASRSSLARWLRQAIMEAYGVLNVPPPSLVTAHSTRALATSWAERAGATPEQICKAATWSSFSTFAKHYRLDLNTAGDQAFGRKNLPPPIFAFFFFLAANTDLTVNGITMSRSTETSLPSIDDFHRAFEVVFVDPLGVVNLCGDMTAVKYRQIQFEAKESLKYLDDTATNGFLQLLMVRKPFVRTFDHVFHITQVTTLQGTCNKMNLHNELIDRGGDYVSTSLPFILPVLKRGLDQRLVLMSHTLPQRPEWEITEEPAKHMDIGTLSIGLLLTPEFYTNILEKGPAADSPEAVEFRKFWGTKSELRRFQDASICEAVVWPSDNVQEKRRIPELIVKHLLQLHADLPESAISYTGNFLDCTLIRKKKPGTGEEQMASVIQSYDDLSRKLWNLEDLPLTVTSVQGTHPSLRYTDVFPPLVVKPEWSFFKTVSENKSLVPLVDKPSPAYVSPIKVICHMEGSGKWPQDKDAIKRVKAAFQIRLGELLKEQHDLLCRPTSTFTDVYKDGYVFRLQVAYHREPQFIKELVTPDGMLKYRDTEESLQLELETIHLTQLTSTLHGLHQQLPAFGGTSRLAKRWISAQLLSDSMSEECVDLLVAYLFLHPAPFTAPSSPQVGFLRFLNLLATFDWKNSALIVNLNGDLTDDEIKEIQGGFSSARAQLPVMFIATPKDKKASVWTKKQPSAQMLQRLIVLAVESLRTLEEHLTKPSEKTDVKVIFRPPLDLYDVMIHLNPKHIPRHREAVDQTAKSFHRGLLGEDAQVKALRFPVVDYDPTQLYLKSLRDSYGDFALFFYDQHGGDVIGVLWNPSSFAPQSFKTTNINGRMVDSKSSLLVPNVEAILEDFRILGEGLVHHIEARTERWNIG
ncbi:PREDICTED: nucleolar protein 6 [Nanorana parkeri]|uniref:nucleolar protein 6 n=1 Tax=Nanorana parkeri TaxID=125878 RepID=UPI000854EAF1|nr:PREDICTED: nucleolar protein 6 [Nanorana parkeri]